MNKISVTLPEKSIYEIKIAESPAQFQANLVNNAFNANCPTFGQVQQMKDILIV